MRRKSVMMMILVLALSMLFAGCAGGGNGDDGPVEDGAVKIQQTQIPLVHPKKFLTENVVRLTTNADELAEACAELDIKPLNVAVFNSNYYQQHGVIAIGVPASKTNKFAVTSVERSGTTATVYLTRTGDASAKVDTNACIFVGIENANLSGIDTVQVDIQPAS